MNEAAPSTGAPTLAQVAKLAGVSVKTASRVFRGERYVTAETAQKVHQAASMLGFRPNRIARELRQGSRSTLIGMITGDLGNPFYARIASVLERELRAAGYQLITVTSEADGSAEDRLAEELLERRVAGLVVVSSASDHHRYLASPGGAPVIFLDRPKTGVSADVVVLDDRAGARAAVRNLLQAGHERIAIISDRGQLATHRERMTGFSEALVEGGIANWECYVRDEAHTARTAKNVVAAVMSRGLPPTALVTTSSLITIGAITAFQRLNRTAGVVGFDDFELAEVLGISVITHDFAALAREGARLLLDRLQDAGAAPRSIVVPCRLIDRGSAGRYELV
ncbi:LacI family transcriptional regulator [Microlunatus elymi]|uniref:LacI family transcriptional regulator n=1 Tax=Microlunatus elymi TaxID=2596828 RepID=A0A516PY21_9ACTN|nr:LacI family DNA-binding transcriptional regulator [Microlunatus elymi]QDP96074.1 LacI family transcriptional regulator [Microlunatus elymi]